MKKIVEKLKQLKGKTLILTHHNADIDAIGSSLALSLSIKSDVGVSESFSRATKNLAKGFDIKINPDCNKYDNIILLDTSVLEQLKGVKNIRADIVIDHHPKGSLTEEAVSWVDEKKKSASQMVLWILKEMKIKLTKKQANLLLAGIIADTAHLRMADLETFKDIVFLLENSADFQKTLENISVPPDESEKIACVKAAKRIENYKSGNLLISFSESSSHEAAIARSLLRLGADISVVFTKKKDELRISSRGKNHILNYGINLSEIFKDVGNLIEGNGGGHDLAGSANGKNKDTEGPKKLILKYISEKTEKPCKKL